MDTFLWSSSRCFFFLFLSSFGYKQASRRKQFSSQAASTPPQEPSHVDIQFYYDFKKVTQIPLELPKDDEVLLWQGFNDVL